MDEEDRPSSAQLAESLGCSARPHPRPAPIVLKRTLIRPAPPAPPTPELDDDPWGQGIYAWAGIPNLGPQRPAHVPTRPPGPPPPPIPLWRRIVRSRVTHVLAAALLIAAMIKGCFVYHRLGSVSLDGHSDWIMAVALSADGNWGATASKDGTARVWDTRSGQETACLKGHSKSVTAVAISADGGRIVTGGDDGTLRVWDRRTGRVSRVTRSPDGEGIARLALSADGRRLVMAGFASLDVWDFDAEGSPHRIRGPHIEYLTLALSADGTRAITNGKGAGVKDDSVLKRDAGLYVHKVWDLSTGLVIGTIGEKTSDPALGLALSSDGSTLAAGIDGIQVMDVAGGGVVQTLTSGWGGRSSKPVAVSADGQAILYSGRSTGRFHRRPRPSGPQARASTPRRIPLNLAVPPGRGGVPSRSRVGRPIIPLEFQHRKGVHPMSPPCPSCRGLGEVIQVGNDPDGKE